MILLPFYAHHPSFVHKHMIFLKKSWYSSDIWIFLPNFAAILREESSQYY